MQRNAVATAEDECLGRRLALWGNLNLLEGFSKVNGFFALYPRETAEFNALLYTDGQREARSLQDFLGVTYTIAPRALADWERRETALPMVTSGQQPIFASGAETLRGLEDPSFDPRRFVYLPLGLEGTVGTNLGTARVTGESFGTHRADIEVEADAPSLVVIAQSHYHRWRASLDGAPVKLLRANHAFQAVLVPAGKHQLKLHYHDSMFRVGLAVSVLALGGLLVVTPVLPYRIRVSTNWKARW
jgi:hypothetical protein